MLYCGIISFLLGLKLDQRKNFCLNYFTVVAGICGIDEFDKMGNQHQALLEAMEQQVLVLLRLAWFVASLQELPSLLLQTS